MNVEIGTEAAQFPLKKYTNKIYLQCIPLLRKQGSVSLSDTGYSSRQADYK